MPNVCQMCANFVPLENILKKSEKILIVEALFIFWANSAKNAYFIVEFHVFLLVYIKFPPQYYVRWGNVLKS